MRRRFLLLVLCLTLFPAGCARVYRDRDWVYEGIVTVAETQNLTVTSDPPAFLWVDGEFTGETPVRVALSYPQSEIRLSKQQYRESGEEREVLDREQNIRRFSQETGHLLRFRAAGHHDRTVRIAIPRAEPTVAVTLRPRAGLDAALDCRIVVTAPPVFFPRIDEIIRENALAPAIRRTPESPTPLGPADLARQTLAFSVPGAEALDRITDELYADARRRNVVFNVTRAETSLDLAANPEREFRAVWISFIDWPNGETDPEDQRRDLVEMLEAFKRLHFNAVFFHARIAGDTYYDSPLEPWSDLLTGKPGGDPGYDPLEFVIEEAHRRGMELHAWVNPFRVRRQATCGAAGSPETADHVARRHPDWVLQFRLGDGRCYRMLDPGRPEVLEYTEKVVTDLVRRYDVDGVHFDDTFYPYPQSGFPGARGEDAHSFQRHGGGQSRGDWRRGNVDRLVERINAAIKSVRPHVRFGISPFGIWRAGVPHGTKGMSAYDAIYTDALAWLEARTIDYLAPQLYWTIGEQPDYERLVDWWGEAVAESGRHLYPGQIIYYVRPGRGRDGGAKPESPREILRQVVLNRDLRNRNVLGNALYRARGGSGEILGTEALRE
ncbi:MAG: family 10 glycosylhydrolase, partial [Thermodesulfobacteriota bacterium]